MEDKRRGRFSLFNFDSEQLNDRKGKFELVSCPHLGEDCKKHVSDINESFQASNRYFRDRDYTRAIGELKSAFYTTKEIDKSSCFGCAELYQSTIIGSLENIHKDLQKMTTGLFKAKRFQSSYVLATEVLDEFRKAI